MHFSGWTKTLFEHRAPAGDNQMTLSKDPTFKKRYDREAFYYHGFFSSSNFDNGRLQHQNAG